MARTSIKLFLIIFTLCTAFVVLALTQCATETGLTWTQMGTRCYIWSPGLATYAIAIRNCAKLKSRLPIFKSSTEATNYDTYTTTNASLASLGGQWLGTIKDNTGKWVTLDDGTPAINSWDSNQPDGDGSCVLRRNNSKWTDVPCNDSCFYSCEQSVVGQTEVQCALLKQVRASGTNSFFASTILTTDNIPTDSFAVDMFNNNNTYAATIHVPNMTQPLYQVTYNSTKIMATDVELTKLNAEPDRILAYFPLNTTKANLIPLYLQWVDGNPTGSTLASYPLGGAWVVVATLYGFVGITGAQTYNAICSFLPSTTTIATSTSSTTSSSATPAATTTVTPTTASPTVTSTKTLVTSPTSTFAATQGTTFSTNAPTSPLSTTINAILTSPGSSVTQTLTSLPASTSKSTSEVTDGLTTASSRQISTSSISTSSILTSSISSSSTTILSLMTQTQSTSALTSFASKSTTTAAKSASTTSIVTTTRETASSTAPSFSTSSFSMATSASSTSNVSPFLITATTVTTKQPLSLPLSSFSTTNNLTAKANVVSIEISPASTKAATTPEMTHKAAAALVTSMGIDPASLSDSVTIAAAISVAIPFIFANMTVAEKSKLFVTLEDTINDCQYDGRPCDMINEWTTEINAQYGNCFTFNGNDPLVYASSTGSDRGLHMILKGNKNEYTINTASAGFILQIHDPGEPALPDTFGQYIPPGFVNNFAFTKTAISKLASPYGNCIAEPKDVPQYYYNGTYVAELCLRSCFQKYVLDKCNCSDPRYAMPAGVKICGIDEKICVDRIGQCENSILDMTKCGCGDGCTANVYVSATSASSLKSDLLVLDHNACLDNCSRTMPSRKLQKQCKVMSSSKAGHLLIEHQQLSFDVYRVLYDLDI